ncbi:hypothetical protein [Streptomyces sp. NPDC003688]
MTVPNFLSDDLPADLGSTAHLISSIGTQLARRLRDVTPPGFVPPADSDDFTALTHTGPAVEQLSA